MSTRDDFSLATKETLAKRVGWRCSNPSCHKLTSGPHEEAHKSINIGVAAHITAAAPGGKRYDVSLSSEQRKSIENGMWLCQNCGKLIDSDEHEYSVRVLLSWKREAERQAKLEVEQSASQTSFRSPINACTLTFNFQDYLDTIVANQSQKSEDGRYVETKAQLPLKVQTVKLQESLERTQRQDAPKVFVVLAGLREFYGQEPVLLIGKPGSGKSTALQRLLLEEAQRYKVQDGALIPVLILLRSCKHGSVLDWIAERLDVEVAEVRSLLRAKRLLLLFDGLNEVPNLDAYQALTQFLEKPNRGPMVFTTRELGVDTQLGIERKLEMLPLTEPQMREFIELRLPGQAETLIRQLGDRLRGLAETPLLLNMLCQVFEQSGKIPQNRGELFRNKFIQDFDAIKHKGVVAADSGFFRFKDELLKHLAMKMIWGDGSPAGDVLQIEKTIAQGWLKDWLVTEQVSDAGEKARIWLEDLVEHHLLQVAGDAKQIEFHHQLFQEYYAAEWLLERVKDLDACTLKQDYLNYLKWTEPIALLLGLCEEGIAILIVEQALDVDLMLGARLAGEVRSGFEKETMRCLFEKAETYPAWLKANLYGCVRNQVAATELINLAQTGDVRLRERSAYIFHLFPDYLALPKLEILIQDQEPSVRKIAVRSLGSIQTPNIVPLIMRVREDLVSSVRQEAILSLSEVGSEAAIQEIIRFLVFSEERWRYFHSIDLESDEHNMITMANHILKNLPASLVVAEILKYLRSSNSIFLNNLISLLGYLSNYNHEETKIVLSKFQEVDDCSVRVSAKGTLSELKRKEEFEFEFSYDTESKDINDSEPDARKQEIEYWRQCLDSENPGLRSNAVLYFVENFRFLGDLGEDIMPILVKALSDDNLNVVSLALANINNSGFTKEFEGKEKLGLLIPVLVNRINQVGTPENIQCSIAVTLGHLGSSDACSVLIRILGETNNAIHKSSIISALGDLKCSVHTSVFISELSDVNSNSMVRCAASTALPQIDATGSSLKQLFEILVTSSDEYILESIQGIQSNCKFYDYEIQQAKLRKADQPCCLEENRPSLEDGGGKTIINQFPNATEVKIFENVQTYHASPPRDPPN